MLGIRQSALHVWLYRILPITLGNDSTVTAAPLSKELRLREVKSVRAV